MNRLAYGNTDPDSSPDNGGDIEFHHDFKPLHPPPLEVSERSKTPKKKGNPAPAGPSKPKLDTSQRILSRPTTCIQCHLVVEMWHYKGEDENSGSWRCPHCGKEYLFKHWKIKRALTSKHQTTFYY